MEGDNTPLYETLFLIINNLCVTYPGLNPLTLEDESFHRIISLYADVRQMQIREDGKKGKKKVIRRRASDNAGWW